MKNNEVKNKQINVEKIETGKNEIILYFDENIIRNNQKYSIILKNVNDNTIWKKETSNIDIKASRLVFNIEDIYSKIKKVKRCIWTALLEIDEGGNTEQYEMSSHRIKEELRFQDKLYYNRLDRVSNLIAEIVKADTKYVVFSIFNEKAVLSVIFVNEERYLEQIIKGKVISIHIKKQFLKIKFRYPKTKYQFEKLVLEYRVKKQADKMEYEFEIDKIIEKANNYIVYANIDLSIVDFKPMYWDLNFVVGDGEKSWSIDIKNQSRIFLMKLCSLFYNNSYQLADNQFVFPYVTLVKKISLQCREKGAYDGFAFKLKERLALVRYLLSYYFLNKQKIFLVYEKFCFMAQDNGYYFFKYCMENNIEEKMGRKIYYIMDKNSPDREVLAPYKEHIVDFMSIKHITYLLASRLLISTDFKAHAYAWRKKGSILEFLIRKKKLVFLQHGVTAFKQVDFLYGKGKTGGCDLFVVTSDFEKKIVLDNFGYKSSEIAVTGFARWDVLNDNSEGSKEIILMPTWRNWLEEMKDDEFKKSNYYLNYMKLLNTPRLHEILEEYDLTMNFYLHPKFKEYLSNFVIDVKRIRFIPFGEEPLNELMMKCKMLITDYSSVAWDTYYQYKPVVFYQFDLVEYNETHGSYIDMEQELFGERVDDVLPLISLIEEYAKKDFQLKAEYRDMHEHYFKYIDDDNSKRICEHIMKKGW
ncbi:MAG: CDP-glycerol glycerophosphotransferase family protein [Lachnotalea sp.]